jgi:putative endonuclease
MPMWRNWPASTRTARRCEAGRRNNTMYDVYILLSYNLKHTYVGITDNVVRRLNQHNRGYHFYTKRHKPWKVIYQEQYNDRLEGRKREKYLKSASGRL